MRSGTQVKNAKQRFSFHQRDQFVHFLAFPFSTFQLLRISFPVSHIGRVHFAMRSIPLNQFPGMEELECLEHEFDPEFYKIVGQCKVPIEVRHHLVQAGYTEASVFAFAFGSSQDFDSYIQKIAETDDLGEDWLR